MVTTALPHPMHDLQNLHLHFLKFIHDHMAVPALTGGKSTSPEKHRRVFTRRQLLEAADSTFVVILPAAKHGERFGAPLEFLFFVNFELIACIGIYTVHFILYMKPSVGLVFTKNIIHAPHL